MTTKIAINGLGRIGRCVFRALAEYDTYADIELVAVNGPAPLETHLHLLKYDSVHGRFPGTIEGKQADGTDYLHVTGHNDRARHIPLFHERDPLQLDWEGLGADIVLECTGKFKTKADAGLHLRAGAKKVLISAPSPDADSTIVYGVNNADYAKSHTVLSVGSCTTNGLAPVARVLQDALGIERGFMTTIHAYTADQNIVDGTHKDMRRARAAGLSMVPTSTGAAKAIGLVLPELKGKLDGIAIRVPTPNVSLVDLTVQTTKNSDVETVNRLMREAAKGSLSGVLATTDEPLVSIDFTHEPASSVFDCSQTYVTGGNMVRIGAWYDNEWGFSCRMLDVARLVD